MMRGRHLLVAFALAATSGSVLADQVNVSNPGATYRNQSFSGGAFRATVVSGYVGETGGFGGTANSFLTFCLERDEFVDRGHALPFVVVAGAGCGPRTKRPGNGSRASPCS